LITYLVYLLFQLKSHSFLYKGTPQHIIDRETEPGILQRLDSTSSSSSSSMSSISTGNNGSRRKVSKRIKAKLGRKRESKTEIQEGPSKSAESEAEFGSTSKEQDTSTSTTTGTSLPKANTDPPSAPNTATNLEGPKPARPALGNKTISIRAPPVFRSSTNPPSEVPESRLRRYRSAPNRESLWQDVPSNPLPRSNSNRSLGPAENDEPPISQMTSIVLLLISTALVALCAEFLVGSIEHLVSSTSLSEAFIGLIILPIVGNAAEHVTAVTVAAKNKLDLSLGVSLGSSIQIALFVTPLVVIIGWIMDKEMSLYFNLFETVAVFVSTFVVNFLVLDGRSNYLEGFLLMMAYVIIAVGAFLFPDDENQNSSTRGPGGG
jgi:Ca2+:H+ antiporter